jgi:hypothetical protein
MMLLEIGLVAGLATYRLTFMVNSETGPAQIFTRFRTRIGVTYDQYSNPIGNNWIAEGVLCFFCLSVWIAFGVCGLLGLAALLGHIEAAVYILFPFALSGGAVYLKKAVG